MLTTLKNILLGSIFFLCSFQCAYSAEPLSTSTLAEKLSTPIWTTVNTRSNVVYSKTKNSFYVILAPEKGPGYIARVNPQTGKTQARFNFDSVSIAFARPDTKLTLSPDERTLIIDQAYHTIGVDLDSETKLWEMKPPVDMGSRYFSSNSQYNIVTGNRRLYLYETRSQKYIRTYEKHAQHSGPAIFVNNDTQLFSSAADGTYALWNVNDASVVYRYTNKRQKYREKYAGAFQSTGKEYVTLYGGRMKPHKFRLEDGVPIAGIADGPPGTPFAKQFDKVNSNYLTFTDMNTRKKAEIRLGPYTVGSYTVFEDLGLLLVKKYDGPIRAVDISFLK